MGALTISVQERGVVGHLRWAWANLTFSASYATGGDTGLTAAALGWDRVVLVQFDHPAGYQMSYNYTTGTVLAHRIAVHTHALHLNQADVADGATTRVNAGTNLLGANTGADVAVAGVVDTTGVGGIVQAAQGALAQVTSTTNLSAVVVTTGNLDSAGAASTTLRCLVFGV